MQDTKGAGYEFYQLLLKVFLDLGMTVNMIYKGLFVYILFVTTYPATEPKHKIEFKKYFAYTSRQGFKLSFLNFRIIQSEH